MHAELLSLGSINADFQLRVPAGWHTQETVAATDLVRLGGGKAANVALLARRMGCVARLLGRVGQDDLGKRALHPLVAAGVDTSGVLRGAQERTAISVVAVPPSGRKSILLAGEANLGFGETDIDRTVGRIGEAPAGSVLVVDYEVTPAAASQAIAAALQRGLSVVVDPSFPAQVDAAALRGVTALTPNEAEAFELAGLERPATRTHAALLDAARHLAGFGVRIVCIKLDDGGCLLWQDEQAWHQHAAPVQAIDTTGAGDAFTGAFALALLEGQDAHRAVLFGVVATELAVQRYGSQPGYRPRAEFMERLHAASRPLVPWTTAP